MTPTLDPAALAAAVRAWQEATVTAVAPISPIRAALLAYLSADPRAAEIAALRAQVEGMRAWAMKAGDMLSVVIGEGLSFDGEPEPCDVLMELVEAVAPGGDWPEARAALSAAPKPGESHD